MSKIPHHQVISTMTSLESVQNALEPKGTLPMSLILDTFATPCLPMLGVFFKIVVFKEGGHSLNIQKDGNCVIKSAFMTRIEVDGRKDAHPINGV